MLSDPSYPSSQIIQFGRRRGPPRVCILDHKPHVRSFLAGMLDEIGFATRECGAAELKEILNEFVPDLVVLGPLNGAAEVGLILQSLKFAGFFGRVMLFGGRNSMALMEMQELGERVGLGMLPPLGTPFHDNALRENVSPFLPIVPAPDVAVDAEEAMQNGWLEMWYQPKIDPHSLKTQGAEAIVRVRHPSLGLMSPSHFSPGASDPYLQRFSQFVIMRTLSDCMSIATETNPLHISVNLPVSALDDMAFVDNVLDAMPEHVCKRSLQIELHCADIVGDLIHVRELAAQLAFRNIGICIDDIGNEGASLAGRADLPVVEMKVGRRYVHGVADDRLKQAVCSEIITTARNSGARVVAEGVDTHADYMAARSLGFDLVQGKLFGGPMELRKFERTVLSTRGQPARNVN